MATKGWSLQEVRILKLLLDTNSYTEISDQLNRRYEAGIKGFRCKRSPEAVRKKIIREGWHEEAPEEEVYAEADERLMRMKAILDEHRIRQMANRRGVMPVDKANYKILILSDLHFPIVRDDFLIEILTLHSDANVVVINGDLLEGYMFSTFPKDKDISATDEYVSGFELVEFLSANFDDVVLIEGNHDARAAKHLQRIGLHREAAGVLRPSLMARMANGEKLDRTGALIEKLEFDNVHYDPIEPWFAKIGKTIIFHPSTMGSDKPGHTVTRIGPKLGRRYPDDEVDSFVCGHTHKLYRGIENGKLYMEQGCLAGMLPYFFKPNNASVKHYQNGYAVVYQDDEGNTDFNKSTVYYLGECMPPKKEVSLKERK